MTEVQEARRVVERVADELEARGVEVIVFHDDTSKDQSTNLNTIVAAHNRETRELDISVHFNASEDHKGHGVEVLYVTQSELAAKLSAAIAAAGHLTDRGGKYRDNLKFLNSTSEPAVLLEIAFCDNASDCNLYREHFDNICGAIADVLGGTEQEIAEPPPEPIVPPEEVTEVPRVDIQISGAVHLHIKPFRG
jgi:N-acetylmuramoyl-L-alanine amidase